MTKIIQFPVSPPAKLGPRKVKKRKPDPEELGQLNLFQKQTKVMSLPGDQSLFDEAMKYDEQGDPDAERLYLLAIEKNENKADAWCNLGILKSQHEENTLAIDYLTKALAEDPRHFEAHYNLANVYSEVGNFDLAKLHYEMAIQIMPDYPNSYYNLGLVLISLKKYKQAIAVIDQYITLDPDGDNPIAAELLKTLKALA